MLKLIALLAMAIPAFPQEPPALDVNAVSEAYRTQMLLIPVSIEYEKRMTAAKAARQVLIDACSKSKLELSFDGERFTCKAPDVPQPKPEVKPDAVQK